MKRMYTAGGLLLADIILLFWVRQTEKLAEWYANDIYPLWVNTVGRLMGTVSFSVIEIILYVLTVAVLVWMGCLLWRVLRRKEGTACFLKNGLCSLVLTAAVFFTLYVLFCGINCYRTSFASLYGMETKTYTTKELMEVSGKLRDEVNALAPAVERNADGEMVLPESLEEMQREAVRTMEKTGASYPVLSGYYPQPKALKGSWILSVQELTGIYAAFSVEANYNKDMTPYNIPFTMCHELSHLKGFMLENEANFIAYLACMQSENVAFRYSGALLGWLYVSNELYERDLSAYYKLYETFDVNAAKDLAANDKFWDTYETKVSEAAKAWNDTYLKATKQAEGIGSYDRVVDLIIQYEKQESDF